MYEFLEDKGLQKKLESGNWTYLLEEEDKYSKSGYKSVQMQLKDCMLKCAMVRFNGQLKFIYFTEGYKSLTELLSTMHPNKLWHVLSKIVESFIRVKKFGFLSCENIDVSPQNIYINPKTFEPYLIYVPLNTEEDANSQMNFIASVRRSLNMALKDSSNPLMGEQKSQLLEIFNNYGHDLEELLRGMRAQSGNVGGMSNMGGKNGMGNVKGMSSEIIFESGKNLPVLKLISMEQRAPIQYVMQKEKITIGRKKDNDIVVDISTNISRMHCSINLINGRYFAKDEGSTHGTYVNNTPCIQKNMVELKNGDYLRMPGIQFLVKIQAK